MATITSSSGTVYYVWPLPALSAKGVEPSIEFSELRNDLGNGYRSSLLYGSNTGLRSWSVRLPTLADTSVLSNTVTGVNGEASSREAAIWDLYCETKVTGTPFAYQCPRNGQYYLVEFADKSLKYEKQAYIKLYSTGIELVQVREDGETIFDVAQMSTTSYGYDWFDQSSHGAGVWTNKAPSGLVLTAAGDVVFSANPQNGLNTVRLSGSASTGVLTSVGFSAPIYEIFIVMTMREATFSNNAGIFTGSTGDSKLVGTSAGTKFQNLLASDDDYFLNGTLKANTDMQAPMSNIFGIVQARRIDGGFDPGTLVQFGKNAGTAGTFAKVDFAEIISFAQPVPRSDARELIEHLTVKWAVGT